MEFVASLTQGRTAAAQCGLFTHKSVPVILEPPCIRKGRLMTCLNMSQHLRKELKIQSYIAVFTADIRKPCLHITSQRSFRYFNSPMCRYFSYETVNEEHNLEEQNLENRLNHLFREHETSSLFKLCASTYSFICKRTSQVHDTNCTQSFIWGSWCKRLHV